MRMLLGMGANIGDPRAALRQAVEAVNGLPQTRVCRVSSHYRTAPVGYTEQPPFYNLVAEIETSLSPSAMLGACLGIEAAMGRERPFKNAPRVIDVDLLLCEGFTLDTPELTVPHPRMGERAFVLIPLEELCPDGRWGEYDLSTAMAAVDRSQIFERLDD